jgi:hypothetical protein
MQTQDLDTAIRRSVRTRIGVVRIREAVELTQRYDVRIGFCLDCGTELDDPDPNIACPYCGGTVQDARTLFSWYV